MKAGLLHPALVEAYKAKILEGILLVVREYLNVARWHPSPKGICEVVAKQLQEANTAVDIMRTDAVLHSSRTAECFGMDSQALADKVGVGSIWEE